MHILDTIARACDAIASLPLEKRRQLVGFACQAATASMRNLDPATSGLLRLARAQGFLSAPDLRVATNMAEAADNEYLSLLSEEKPQEAWIDLFSKARLLTALTEGLGDESSDNAASAIYEVCKSVDDENEIVRLVQQQIAILRH